MQFDTLDYAKRLETVGVPAPQAEAQAKALGDALGKAVAFPGDLVTLENNLALKLATVEARLGTRIDTTRKELETRIDTTRRELESTKTELKLELGGKIETLKWMFGVLVALNVGIMIRLLYIH